MEYPDKTQLDKLVISVDESASVLRRGDRVRSKLNTLPPLVTPGEVGCFPIYSWPVRSTLYATDRLTD